jgi:hypothetical protein
MRTLFLAVSLAGFIGAGCAGGNKKPPAAAAGPQFGKPAPAASGTTTNQSLIVTPENALVGKVVLYNAVGRFVVLNFPIGKMATVGQRFDLYRRGLKVGEVKVTGPQRENNTVADLTAGEAEVGDEARSQ